MKPSRALIVYGGWEGHEPAEIAALFRAALEKEGFEVAAEATLEAFDDGDRLKRLDLIVPCWTMGALTKEQGKNLVEAVRGGVGLGGVHGGMGDAFRGNLDYEWMVGGHFVGHPHVGDYVVTKTAVAHPVTEDLPDRFDYNSEQYYMLMDPVVDVLAETQYVHEGRECTMPVVWIKQWGEGRVFYSALGHKAAEFSKYPQVMAMSVQGLKWAAGRI